MSDDDMKADSNLPAQTKPKAPKARNKSESDKVGATAAWEALEKRRSRLEALKFESTGKPHLFRPRSDDELAVLRILDTFAVGDSDAANLLLNTLFRVNDVADETGTPDMGNGVLALLHQLEPRDAVEAMLCSQMISTHLLTMECFKRANLTNQTFEGRELNMRHGERLSRIYAQQVDALNKHRGKGQQKVTVEHVTVNAGGQAVVGNVEG